MFGKLARVPDELIAEYRLLVLDFFRDPSEAQRVAKGLEDVTLDPWQEKRRLAREIVDLYQGEGAGPRAEAAFDRVHKAGELPEEISEQAIPPDLVVDGTVYLPKLLAVLGLADSASRARGTIEQGGVRVDGERIQELEVPVDRLKGGVLQVGRRKFVKLV
jgi:tyrosyl-tRNA synthetase